MSVVLHTGYVPGSIGRIDRGVFGHRRRKRLRKGAHLRWFIASDALKGQGIGSALLKMAVGHVDSRRFMKTYLWTFEDLAAARHLYSKFGFRLVHEARGAQWGKEVNEQMYVRAMPDPSCRRAALDNR